MNLEILMKWNKKKLKQLEYETSEENSFHIVHINRREKREFLKRQEKAFKVYAYE